MPPTSRRVAFAGKTLSPGHHTVTLGGGAATVLVGASAGPRAVVIGGVEPGDSLGLAVARRVCDALDGAEVAGSLVLAPQLGRPRRRVLDGAAFVVEVRAGPPGWATAPHVRADLRSARAARLARAFGAATIVDAPAGLATLRFEGGERGRVDDATAAAAAAGILRLLAARGVLRGVTPAVGGATRRVVIDEIVRVKLRRGGTVVPVVAPGTPVRRGGGLLAVYDEAGRERTIVEASQRSVVLATAAGAQVAPGGAVARLGRVRAATRAPAAAAELTVGWCEWVALPELGIARLHAKIDTGARTSALHVRDLVVDGHVASVVLPGRRAHVTLPILEHVTVRDSGGHDERRPVIETVLALGPIRRRIRLTLTDRGDMAFPMLVGRSALGAGVRVDASRRELLGP